MKTSLRLVVSDLVDKAITFATKAHGDQKRKYTEEPYISHPIAVMEIVKTVPHTEEMLAAAVLHDVIEDTDQSYDDIYYYFGDIVADLVQGLTDVSHPDDGNRQFRKALDRQHLAEQGADVQTIKLADMIHNTSTTKDHDPEFWKIYQKEKIALLEVLTKGSKVLHSKATEMITE
jgi:(p)ppGpp synthase/HD superfamily hydrolase